MQYDKELKGHLYYKSVNEVNEALLREMIEESFILGLEAFEMKRIKIQLQTKL